MNLSAVMGLIVLTSSGYLLRFEDQDRNRLSRLRLQVGMRCRSHHLSKNNRYGGASIYILRALSSVSGWLRRVVEYNGSLLPSTIIQAISLFQ